MRSSKIFTLLTLLALVLTTFSCDIIEGPKKDYSTIQGNSARRVLLEEFTGQRCPNCPNANAKARELDSIYGENLIIIAIHATAFAVPVPSLGYPYDYRTDIGDELAVNLGADDDGLPNGAVNRTLKSQDKWVWKFSEWTSRISEQLAETPVMDLEVASTFDETTRTASISVDMEFFEDVAADHQLVVVITEDSIVSRQLDITTEYPNYVHRHMLRGSVTAGFYGESISPSPIEIGDQFTKNFTYTLPVDWNADHCEVVAYVHRLSDKKVMQAAEAHVK
jgi:hypothetical protein